MSRDVEPDRERVDPAPRDQPDLTPRERSADRRAGPEHLPADREREVVSLRGRVFELSEAERRTLFEVGRFRTVAREDVHTHLYPKQERWLEQDLRSLVAQGLIQRRSAWIGKRHGSLEVLVLTKAAKELLERDWEPDAGQRVYAGFVKPSEVAHDAAIYRMFQAERRVIEQRGGAVLRVILDYELKRNIYAPLNKLRHLPAAEFAERQRAVAHENHLTVVQNRIVLPDLRIEYETRDGELARVDLELATEHYHGSHLADKAAAGFRIYVADGSAGRLTRVLEEREITATILSL